MRKFLALSHARNMEFIRDKGTLFWNIIFPLFLVFGFTFAFSERDNTFFKVGVTDKPEKLSGFIAEPYVKIVDYEDFELALHKLENHQLDMAINFRDQIYSTNQESARGRIAARIFTIMQASREPTENPPPADSSSGLFREEKIQGEPIRYIDWFVPGVIAMNMMFSCMFGVGWVIIRYRKNGVLKRLKATPVTALEFILSQIFSRLVIVMITATLVYTGTNFFLNFMMKGSYLNLMLLTAITTVCMISLGLAMSTRIRSEELGGGLMNLVIWPMTAFSGIFFSLEGTPRLLQLVSNIFPLTHFTKAARDIMLNGAGLVTIMPNLVSLTGLSIILLAICSLTFRWE